MLTLPLKFKAGKVDYNEDSGIYTPNPTKGEIELSESGEGEGFYSFVWKPRDSIVGNIEPEELLVFVGDVSWRKISSCKTGRIYMLSFMSSGAKNLFWMQDVNNDDDDPSKESEKDREICTKINELLME